MQPLPDNMFHGKPCIKCEGVLRYKDRGNHCVACVRANGQARKARGNALAVRLENHIYEGKPCAKCSGKSRYTKTGRCVPCNRSGNNESLRKYRKIYNKKYSDKSYLQSLVRAKLKMSAGDYSQLCEDQDFKCAICNQMAPKGLHVDHCHTSGKFRGLLCGNCNRALGMFGDSIERLKNAIKYLEDFAKC